MKIIERKLESLSPKIQTSRYNATSSNIEILLSPNDLGVMRNRGRNGSRYAPKAIINALKKLNHHLPLKENESILLTEVFAQSQNGEEFGQFQENSFQDIKSLLSKQTPKKVTHIGGGHDHVFPFLRAIDQLESVENILILNIDAHCDTRIDHLNHSGTPFRNFDKMASKPFHLVQIGIQHFANSKSTLSELTNGSEKKFFIDELTRMTENFQQVPQSLLNGCPFEITEKTALVFSLDCDGIDGKDMPAVSSVNPHGIPFHFLLKLLRFYHQQETSQKFLGIYEFNPLFDDVGASSAKKIASFIYEDLMAL